MLLIKYSQCLLLEKLITLIKLSKNYVNPEYEIYVDPELNYTIRAYSYSLSPTCCLYTNYEKSCFNVALPLLVKDIVKLSLCDGIGTFEVNVVSHVLQKI